MIPPPLNGGRGEILRIPVAMWLSETVIPFVLSTAFETEPSTSAVRVSLRRGGISPWRSGARAA